MSSKQEMIQSTTLYTTTFGSSKCISLEITYHGPYVATILFAWGMTGLVMSEIANFFLGGGIWRLLA
jgi:hypothetical protein